MTEQSNPRGLVSIVLHAHAPYVRQSGPSAEGEEPLHRLTAETYIPLLAGLYDVLEQGVPVRLGIALSPILLEQLADRVVQKHLYQSFSERVEQAQAAVKARVGDDHGHYLAQFELQLAQRVLRIFDRQWGRDIVAATRNLVEAGVIEPLVHTATHIVPQLHDLATMRTQFQIGQLAISRHLGRRPLVAWGQDDPMPRGLLELLPLLGIHGIVGRPDATMSLTDPCWLDRDRKLWALPPHEPLALHVRSLTWGYPGDPLYRAPERPGFTRNGTRYDPFHAYARARLHAKHYIGALLAQSATATPQHPTTLVLALDMELLGSGWIEGGMWLRTLLEEIHRQPALRLVTPSAALAEEPPTRYLAPQPGESAMIDGALYTASRRLRDTILNNPRPDYLRERMLNQAARELLLAQSGDWDRWHGSEYARARRISHLVHVQDLLRLTTFETLSPSQEKLLAALEEQDNPFPFLHFGLFTD